MTHPYSNLPRTAYWSTGVARADKDVLAGLYTPKIDIDRETRIATAGSCFAQHISRYLNAAGCAVQNAEPAPQVMPDDIAKAYGYKLFSGRYGNIYTARQMRQLIEEVADGMAEPRYVWENDGRFRDALRPTVEPDGLSSTEEVLLHRNYHLERTSQMLKATKVFVFTLGLTEAWVDRETGRVFPVCPGVAGGTFDPDKHAFRVYSTSQVIEDLNKLHKALRRFNPGIKLLLTVSPVPLTATASGQHVLNATSAAKSTLRAAAADFTARNDAADYFPSYEIITQPGAGGPYFAPNLRSITPAGIAKVMEVFFAAHGLVEQSESTPPLTLDETDDDSHCDDILLDAFAS